MHEGGHPRGGPDRPAGINLRCDGPYYRGDRMNDRTRAMEVLRQARETLLSRLAERVLDNREDILDDAGGYSYCGAIESMHDQLGQRLANVTALLAHLQSADESPTTYDSTSSDVMGTVPEVDAVFGIGLEGLAESNASSRKDSTPTIRLDAENVNRAHAPITEWESPALDWSASAPAAEQPEEDVAASDTPPIVMPRISPTDEAATVIVETDQADAGCRDHVFQETDFRGVDLLAADFETGLIGSNDKLLSSAESGSGDLPMGE